MSFDPYIRYLCDDSPKPPPGCHPKLKPLLSETVAETASLALVYWVMRLRPQRLPENPELFKVYVVGAPMPGPYNPNFLVLVMAGVEQKFGTMPPFPEHLLQADWYTDLPPTVDFKDIITLRDDERHQKIIEYETACLNLLKWLRQYGDVVELYIRGE